MNNRLCGAGAAMLGALTLVVAVSAQSPAQSVQQAQAGRDHGLPLGPGDLTETRTTRTLQPGVTLTRIVRGADAAALPWTVELSALRDETDAGDLAAALTAEGFDARAEEVTTPRTADFAGGTLGWRVRVGEFDAQADANAERTRLRAAGHAGFAWYTGWDGESTEPGPWHVDVLTIDPRKFRGGLDASYGPDLERRETTSELARAADATAAVNAGFYVLNPSFGAPGDPAGLGVYDGRLLSEPVGARPSFVFRADGRHSAVSRLTWQGRVSGEDASLPLDGINRVPGLIRNCGGTADDTPTALPLHDVTCADAAELVAFTEDFGAATPTGEGLEAVLDAHGRVVETRTPRGGPLPAGGSSVQATGEQAAELSALARVGERLRVRTTLRDERGRRVTPSHSTGVLNGGPELVRDGRLHATPAADGMVHADNPNFYYGWVHKRNPRTIAGVDDAGRTVLVTADGRGTGSLGLSIPEAAAVAKSLGMRDAVNLDGGGSTTMVVGGDVINDTSDGAGERPVGDALLILPDRREK